MDTELYQQLGWEPNAYEKLQAFFEELNLKPKETIADLVTGPWENLQAAPWSSIQKVALELRKKAINLSSTGIDSAEEKAKQLNVFLSAVEKVLQDEALKAEYNAWLKDSANKPAATEAKREVRQLDPIQQGWAFLEAENFERAREIAAQEVQRDPQNADAWVLLGQVRLRIDDIQGAINAYKQVIALHPEVARPHRVLGILYGAQKDWDNALRQHNEALKLFIEAKDTSSANETRESLGQIYVATKRYDAAIPLLEICVKEDPSNTAFQELLADAYLDGMLAHWTPIQEDGEISYLITEGHQAYKSRRYVKKALALPRLDAEEKARIRVRANQIQKALHRDWPTNWWKKGAWIIALSGILGIVLLFLHDIIAGCYFFVCAGLYVLSARVPAYLNNRKLVTNPNAQPGASQNGCLSALAVLGIELFFPIPLIWNFLSNYIVAPLRPALSNLIRGLVAGLLSVLLLGLVVLLALNGTLTIASVIPATGGTADLKALAPGSALIGYSNSQGQELVTYISANGHVHELTSSGSGWIDSDLSASDNVPTALASSSLDAYSASGVEYINYLGSNHHVYELYEQSSGWTAKDLTKLSKGHNAISGSALTGYRGSSGSQHVNYITTDHHIHELYFDGSNWADNDLTALAQGKNAISDSGLVGYVGNDGSVHVNYIGSNHHIYELYFSGSWSNNDLTSLSQGNEATAGTPLAGYWDHSNNVHVFFIGSNGHINELFFNQSKGHWNDNDLTSGSNSATVAGSGSSLVAALTSNNNQYLEYIGADGHIHQLSIASSGWHDDDITTESKAAAPLASSSLDSYFITGDKIRVDYIAANQHINEIYF